MMNTNNNNELTIQLDLWPFYLDFEKRYPLSRLVSRMIHVSGEHATHFGFGIEKLMNNGASWVLSKMTIDFLAPIDVSLPLAISTGVVGWSGLTTDRVIRLSQDGTPIAEAMSKWVAIDIQKRLPIPIDKVFADKSIKSEYLGLKLPETPRRLWSLDVQEKLMPVYEHTVRYSDLDINCHVNTSVWISLAMDAIPLEIVRSREIKKAYLRFVKEGRAGNLLSIARFATPDTECLQVSSDGTTYFQLLIEWKEEKA